MTGDGLIEVYRRRDARSRWQWRQRPHGSKAAPAPAEAIALQGVELIVDERGREEYLRTGRATLHACACGRRVAYTDPPANAERVRYRPREGRAFTTADGREVRRAARAWATADGRLLVEVVA